MCKAFGINGKTGGQYEGSQVSDPSRSVRVQFMSTNASDMVWDFYSTADQLEVNPGAVNQMIFVAHNPTDRPMSAQAIPSITPAEAAAYFHKTECFCFTQQVLQPGERIEMPVRFIVDRDLPASVKHLTLAYTLFDITARHPPVAHVAAQDVQAPVKEGEQQWQVISTTTFRRRASAHHRHHRHVHHGVWPGHLVQRHEGRPPGIAWPADFLRGRFVPGYMLFGWFGAVVKESRAGLYSPQLDRSFRWGMSWFIFSEVMFFLAFFGALFYVRVLAGPWLGGEGAKGVAHMLWPTFEFTWPLLHTPDPKLFPPPKEVIDPWHLPLINTILLVSSSVTITIAHHALRRDHRGPLKFWMALTILLGLSFIALQAFEYHEAYTKLGLTLGSGIYGATFFMLTGFHGAHVTLGTIILIVMFVRILRGHFNPEKHFGFEAASWYWHFVDVVWVGLFIFVYVL